MGTSVERVLNNPYLLADIMRHVAQVDKAPNVLSTLCVSHAFRNPHVISEALRSITYIYYPHRKRVTSDSVMSCVDVDHANDVVERSELKIDGLLLSGSKFRDLEPSWERYLWFIHPMKTVLYLLEAIELSAPGQFNIDFNDIIMHIYPDDLQRLDVSMEQHGPYTILLRPLLSGPLLLGNQVYTEMSCAEFCQWLKSEIRSAEQVS
jgi:hypothetical protein